MISGVLALLERSLRVDARERGHHLARFGLMVFIYAAIVYTLETSNIPGAAGQ